MPSVRVSEAELEQLFDALSIWEKAHDGRLHAVEEAGTRSPARLCAAGQSYFVRLHNSAGLRVARIHHVVCPDGGLLSWPSALLVGEVTIYRTGHD